MFELKKITLTTGRQMNYSLLKSNSHNAACCRHVNEMYVLQWDRSETVINCKYMPNILKHIGVVESI